METIAELMDLRGKTAIVTGGAVGIGFGIALRLAEAGANVVIANRTKEDGVKAAHEIEERGWEAKAIATDVSIEESVRDLVDQTVAAYGEINILVNNAGVYPIMPVLGMSLSEFEKVMAINLRGVFLCTKYVSDQMIQKGIGGKILNITSIDALHPSSVGLAHYDASKHGVWGFTKNIALELAPHRIWVNAVAPGGIITPGVQRLQKSTLVDPGMDVQAVVDSLAKRTPMQRLGEPDDIGKVVLFLASGMASYITGAQIVVDGGLLLMYHL